MLHPELLILVLTAIVTVKSGKPPTTSLKWISEAEAKRLRGPGTYDHFVQPANKAYQLFCRANIDGCYYPGQLWIRDADRTDVDRQWDCTIITEEKNIFEYKGYFEVLYNPQGAAKVAWLSWPKGTDDTNFPDGVVMSDPSCNLRIGRYNDYNEPAMVDGNGYVYYQNGISERQCCWYWDNNEYDLLIEKTVSRAELLDVDYDTPIKRKTINSAGNNVATSEGWLTNAKSTESERSAQLSVSYTNSKSWSHSFTVAVGFQSSVEISSPGKGIVGGASATLGFERSFSWQSGWGGHESQEVTTSHTITETVPPRSRIKVKLFIRQTMEDIPYRATYKLFYSDGSTSIVKDKGVLHNVVYSTISSESGPLEKL
eukprot:GFUD01025669.1.p1 GENE.GFUD01025669.1~~GFUD01025669.1.p1  ORF type:complete len:371 (+),score=57.88 GFUD01025669.1:110-1222(+)